MEPLEILKKKFEDYVALHNDALAKGNGKMANRIHKKIQDLYHQVKNANQIEIFRDYLDSYDESMCLWAASLCLKTYPQEAEKQLVKLSKSTNPMISISAKAALDFYTKGSWDKLIV